MSSRKRKGDVTPPSHAPGQVEFTLSFLQPETPVRFGPEFRWVGRVREARIGRNFTVKYDVVGWVDGEYTAYVLPDTEVIPLNLEAGDGDPR